MSDEEFLKVFEEVKQYAMENYYAKFIDTRMFGRDKSVIITFDTKYKFGEDISVEINFRMFDDIENCNIIKEYNKIIEYYENKYGMEDLLIRKNN